MNIIPEKTLAIMQPYVFPYIGYFCLLKAADEFVFYDDVNYIKQGWINRNRLLVNGAPYTFTVPVSNGSPNEIICNVKTTDLDFFCKKFFKTVEQSYSKSPNFIFGMNYIERVFSCKFNGISELAIYSILEANKILGIKKKIYRSSQEFNSSKGLDKSDRIIKIAKQLGCCRYINTYGGIDLYDKEYFMNENIYLQFLKPHMHTYQQNTLTPITGLSIIDILMNLSIEEINFQLSSYELI